MHSLIFTLTASRWLVNYKGGFVQVNFTIQKTSDW